MILLFKVRKIYIEDSSVSLIPKEISHHSNSQIYTLEKEITDARDRLCSSNLEIEFSCTTVISWKYIVPFADSLCLHIQTVVLYFSTAIFFGNTEIEI